MWYIHTMDYYLAIKRNNIVIHTTWMNLKNITVSERNKSQGHILYISNHMKCQNRQIYKNRE